MAKKLFEYQCKKCGARTPKWAGQCSECKAWNTLEEVPAHVDTPKLLSKNSTKAANVKQIKDVDCTAQTRIITGITEFDRVMGGGLVHDSISILAAPPGAGKSTLSIMLCNKMLELGMTVFYASGEESETQIKNRALRLGLSYIDNLWITNNTNLDTVLEEIKEKNADFIVIDSIQTFYLNEFLPSRAGNLTQVNECAGVLRDLAKDPVRPRAVLLIGQMTKDDELAGSRQLEHLVDTYIQIEGNSDDNIRTLSAVKNRFGNTGEMGFFSMEENGLISIDNPSEYFMTERQNDPIGSALTVIREGTRSIIVEVESLVSASFTPYPSRIGECLRKEQINILVSILEQRGKVNLYNKNVIVKTTGGIRLQEPGANLAVIMAIASSAKNAALPKKYVYIADVGLTGDIKKVPNTEMRIKELARMGYERVFIARNAVRDNFVCDGIEIVQCSTLLDVLNKTWN